MDNRWIEVCILSLAPVLVFVALLWVFRYEHLWIKPTTQYWGAIVCGYLFMPITMLLGPYVYTGSIYSSFRADMYLNSCLACTFGLAMAATRIDETPRLPIFLLVGFSIGALIIRFIQVVRPYF